MCVHPVFQKFSGGNTPRPPVGTEGERQWKERAIPQCFT